MPGLYRVTVFDAGGSRPRLEWETPDGHHRQRVLDRAELSKLIESAEHEYAADHPNLVDLGSQVSRWIDGPADRWLAAALEQQGPFRLHIAPDEGLRSLPWEILHTDRDGFLSVNPTTTLTPIRRACIPRSTPVGSKIFRSSSFDAIVPLTRSRASRLAWRAPPRDISIALRGSSVSYHARVTCATGLAAWAPAKLGSASASAGNGVALRRRIACPGKHYKAHITYATMSRTQ